MFTIDGSYGEGGGQVLRTSLSLAAITGQAVRIINVRAGRAKPGLAAQHLTCVRAVAEVAQATVEGDCLGSQMLTFRPGTPKAGRYVFDVADIQPSAGSVNLIAQTLLPVLARCDESSEVILRGGTHVPWSPTFEYLVHVFLPAVRRFGVQAETILRKAGFYPRGGGEETLRVGPSAKWRAEEFAANTGQVRCRLLSRITRLPEHVGERQLNAMRSALAFLTVVGAEVDEMPGPAPGTTAIVFAERDNGLWGGCSALGAKGKPAEQVGREAAEGFRRFVKSRATVDLHLADQILLYAALAEGTSTFTVEAITEHFRTNMWVIEQFLGPCFTVLETAQAPSLVTVRGAGDA